MVLFPGGGPFRIEELCPTRAVPGQSIIQALAEFRNVDRRGQGRPKVARRGSLDGAGPPPAAKWQWSRPWPAPGNRLPPRHGTDPRFAPTVTAWGVESCNALDTVTERGS